MTRPAPLPDRRAPGAATWTWRRHRPRPLGICGTVNRGTDARPTEAESSRPYRRHPLIDHPSDAVRAGQKRSAVFTGAPADALAT
jgi:hypothetical protein